MPSPEGPIELTVLQPAGRPERADAARNREKILCHAARLFAERGVQCVSMDDIAEHAQVGKGTLYRRFGDRSGLALALLQQQEIELQDGMLRGAPPLGPGAPPRERLHAFLAALAEHNATNRELLLEVERRARDEGRGLGAGPYGAYHTHVRLLLAALDPGLDADVLAHVLLAPFRGATFQHVTGDGGEDGRQRLLDAVDVLLAGLPGPAGC